MASAVAHAVAPVRRSIQQEIGHVDSQLSAAVRYTKCSLIHQPGGGEPIHVLIESVGVTIHSLGAWGRN